MKALFRICGRDRLTVLMFHRVPVRQDVLFPEEPDLSHFRLLLQFLQQNFRILPLQEAVRGIRGGTLPPAAACLTFDDGYSDWLSGVVPVLKEHAVPATFLITTSQLLGEPVWYERVAHAVRHCRRGEIDLTPLGLGVVTLASESDRGHLIRRLCEHCKYHSLAERSDMLATLEDIFGPNDQPVPCMSAAELRQLVEAGFEIGAHTVNHPILRFCSAREAEHEIAACREVLASISGSPITAFAYPNGKVGLDIQPEHLAMVRNCGYTCALTTQTGVARSGDDLLQIPRFTPWGRTSFRMAAQMARNLFTRPELLPGLAEGFPHE